MTVKSVEELIAQANATLADNVTGAISAADVRQMILDILDSGAPGYGVITLTGPSAELLGAAPAVISPWTAIEETTAGVYTASAANGLVTRLIASAGLVGATDFITVSGSVSGANNANVTIEVYKNGAPTGMRTSVTCTGTADYVGFNMADLQYTAGVDAEYDLRASAPAGSYNFQNVRMIGQSQPVRAY